MATGQLRVIFHRARTDMNSTSTWFALRNPVFCRLWLASVLSGTFVSAQDMAATWLMHDLGGSSLALSLMATAASAPFFCSHCQPVRLPILRIGVWSSWARSSGRQPARRYSLLVHGLEY